MFPPPSIVLPSNTMSAAPKENVKWVDGLRGIASLLVVATHLARGFDEDLFKSISKDPYKDLQPGEVVVPRLFQYPYLRVLVQGRIGVSIFALVTGYVCALKPIRQFRAGQMDAAFSGIAKSAFRRTPRLFLPTTIITVASWFICQFGVYQIANRSEGWWINHSSPNMTPWIGRAIYELLNAIVTTWSALWNPYDINHWTLQPLLKGAFWVYTFLIGTAYMKPRYRMTASLILVAYFYVSKDAHLGSQFFFGTFLTELSQDPGHTAWLKSNKWPARTLTPICIIFGLMLASYPEKNPEWRPWSLFMLRVGHRIFPDGSEYPRNYSSLGLFCITLGIHFSSGVKDVLSNKYLLWFGKNSFAVYLLHGTLLRTILVWMLFGVSFPKDVEKEGKMVPGPPLKICGRVGWYFWVPIWLVMLYSIANQWTKHVDPFCARMTARIENYMFEEQHTTLSAEAQQNREKAKLSPLPR
ncbi:acyltransferas-like protein [Calycina marina]|uniref:Acyltransferas-like protein n=1 Tax=Calycina marina TaxID=1763456 RepID=A0A9P7YW23_9HELO|nr:acyltransferas-like protein [Calycina marina]